MLRNKSKNKILARKIGFCKNSFSKALGLMFSRKSKTLIFIFEKEKIISLHMFFVFYPIDVLFLDRNKKIVQLKENFKPFRIMIAKKPAKYIIELPEGIIKKTNTRTGDTISF
jgi:uncharacterized membrane protein (UPF0127 family)